MPLWQVGGNIPIDCPSGTYLFAWNGDYPADTDKGCFTNGTVQKDGTLSGGTISTDYGQTGYGFRKTANNQYLQWAVSGNDGINPAVGTMWMSVYVVDDGARTENTVFESYVGSADFIAVASMATNYLCAWYYGNSSGNSLCSNPGTLSVGVWTRIAYSWDDSNNLHSYKIGAGSWVQESEAINTWISAADKILIGESGTGGTETDTIYIDNVFILSTYQAGDPL